MLPKLVGPDKDVAWRFIEFFTVNIRNPHTGRAYAGAAVEFAVWCEQNDVRELAGSAAALHRPRHAQARYRP